MASRTHDRFGIHQGMATARSTEYLQSCCGRFTDMDSRTESLYGRHIDKRRVIEAYTEETPLYRTVNECLRENRQLAVHGDYIYHCRERMKEEYFSGRKFEGECWRGVTLSQTVIQEYRVGRRFLWPAFTSTTRERNKAFDGNVLFLIDCDGLGITYSVDIAHLSKFPWEKEVLIYPYSGFVVKDVGTSGSQTLIRLQVHDTLRVEHQRGMQRAPATACGHVQVCLLTCSHWD
mmetsp:Transcript_42824/g.137885  ORF Transcript_42824/g.137885 Transcript_42824/m.137885 type:complete len:233 (-) Transcript_42824:6-704(-)